MAYNARRTNDTVTVVFEMSVPPLPDGKKGDGRIAAFYRQIEEATTDLIDRLDAAAQAEYAAMPGRERRCLFSFYRLSMTVRVCEESDLFFSATHRLILQRGGKLLYDHRAAELFLRHTGAICTPFALRLRGYRIPRGKGDLYMENGLVKRL
jgi:hypothetical protein